MALFLSTYRNKLDKKGRVSVPATFRAAIAQQAQRTQGGGEPFAGIVVFPSLSKPCLEAAGMGYIEKLYGMIDAFDPLSEERDLLANGIFGQCAQLPFDSEGRVMLPETLLNAVRLQEEVVFVGKGETFSLWTPEAHLIYAERARDRVREMPLRLRQGSGS